LDNLGRETVAAIADLGHHQWLRPKSQNGKPTGDVTRPIRWLAQLFVISADEQLRTEAQAAITAFPDTLAFEIEEEKTVTELVARKRRTAEIWSGWGKLENYRATPAPDGSGTYIQLENPNASRPDVVAVTESNVRLNDRLGLLHWATASFENQSISPTLTVEVAPFPAWKARRPATSRRRATYSR
jgi:hypothetical protein